MAFQARYMQQLPLKQKVAKVLPYLQRAGWVSTPAPCAISERLQQVIQAAGERIVVAGDVLNYTELFLADDQLTYDEEAFDKRIAKPPEAPQLLVGLSAQLAGCEPFVAARLETVVKDFVDRSGVTIGQVIHALRVAVTGKAVGFGMFETLEILGREACLRRIDLAVQRASGLTRTDGAAPAGPTSEH
jgi:glutamyl-tRNA synthetase